MSKKGASAHSDGRKASEMATQQEIREQEVLRANRELAAYFRGRRTEREARAALKILKAFVRDRERVDPAKRRPLPAARVTKAPAARKSPQES
jgi:hypothetical protein